MTDDNHPGGTRFDRWQRYVPLAAWAIIILTLLVIPLKVISYGYLPSDDALRHAAKAVSGKPWSKILILNQAYNIDHEFGWSLLLEKIQRAKNADAESLVILSVVTLFLLVGWSVLPWLKRPEAWLITIILMCLTTDLAQRLMLGRPYLVTMAALLNILFLWQTCGTSAPKGWMMGLMTFLIALSTFVHGIWYLWALPVAAFFLAGQFRWGTSLMICSVLGVFLGSALTGHPVQYLLQAVQVARCTVGMQDTVRIKVSELRPFNGDVYALMIMGGFLVLRRLARLDLRPLAANPVFWLVILEWMLGFVVGRFWFDWGWPALMVLITSELQWLLQIRFPVDSFRRLGLVGGLALTMYMVMTSDLNSRWTYNLTWQFLTPDNKDLAGWLPDQGGIFYTADMTLFYETFYKNPRADWRYLLGFEPTLMPAEDFQVYHNIIWNFGDGQAYEPWVKKMKPPDRLVIRSDRSNPPNIPELEWEYGVSGIWVGRVPRTNAPPPAPTVPALVAPDRSTRSPNLSR